MIELVGLTKTFSQTTAVNNMNLDVYRGEFLTFLGPSGCGKTTTLRMIAGFEEPTAGQIILGGKNCEALPPEKRDVNTVFQNYALFPHLSIRDNIAFGLKLKKLPKPTIRDKVEQAICLVKLEEHVAKKPSQLSGGQKQRVAIARAIVNEPKVLLLDEPLGALDLKLRKEMQLELKHLQKTLGITFIYVTHDQEEALTMSDRIVVMNRGNIEQVGVSEEIYESPRTRFVADFIGETNLIAGVVTIKGAGFTQVESCRKRYSIEGDYPYRTGEALTICVRPENIHFTRNIADVGNYNCMEGIYEESVYVGNMVKHILRNPAGETITINRLTRKGEHFEPGQAVGFCWSPKRAVLVDAQAGPT
ncbi:MAG: ABC transporter ATP-binding protein [Lachnospiraceae bacterium]|nr:ABC transporter ATP-binding protein [Lachnospiraceae bacterium]